MEFDNFLENHLSVIDFNHNDIEDYINGTQDDYTIYLPLALRSHFVPNIPYPEDIERDTVSIGVDEDMDGSFDSVDVDGDGNFDISLDTDGVNTVNEIHEVLEVIENLGTDEFLYEIHLQSGVYDLTQNAGEYVETVEVQQKYLPEQIVQAEVALNLPENKHISFVGDDNYEQGTGSLIFPSTEFIVDANIADIGLYSQGGDLRLSDIAIDLRGSPDERVIPLPLEEHLNSAVYSVGSEDYDTIFKADDLYIENNYLEENPDVVTDQVYNGLVTVDHDNVWLSNSEIKGDLWDGIFVIQSDRVLIEDTDILRSDESAMLMGCAVATSKYDKYLEQQGWPTDLSIIDSEIVNYQKGIGAFSEGEGQKMTLHNVDFDVYDEVPMLWLFFNWGWGDTEETVVSNVNIKQEEEGGLTQGAWIFGWGGDIGVLNCDMNYVTDENIQVPTVLIAQDLAEELRLSERTTESNQGQQKFTEQFESVDKGYPNYNFLTFHIPEQNNDSPINRLVITVRSIDDITAEKFGNLRNPEDPKDAMKGVSFISLETGEEIENPFQNVEDQ